MILCRLREISALKTYSKKIYNGRTIEEWERELASLKGFYDKDGIGMTVICGRRRIGKSTLITKSDTVKT